MAETGRLTSKAAPGWPVSAVTMLRIALILAVLVIWEGMARSGLLYRDVVPSLLAIGQALFELLSDAPYYSPPQRHRRRDRRRTGDRRRARPRGRHRARRQSLPLAGVRALSLLSRADPEDHLLPDHDHVVRGRARAPRSRSATLSCFFPIALSVAAGMRQIDKVLIRVGKSFRANTWQMVTKIYMPAMRHPIINGVRLGFGVALIGTLLAETKLSNKGIGFLIIQAYSVFDMPSMYAMLIVLFALAIGANALIGRLGGIDTIKTR